MNNQKIENYTNKRVIRLLTLFLGALSLVLVGSIVSPIKADAYNLLGCKLAATKRKVFYGSLYTAQTGSAISNWNSSSDITLSQTTNINDPAKAIYMMTGNFGNTSWSGLMTGTCSSGTWTGAVTIQVNTVNTGGYNYSEVKGVIAHEIGHALGLGHNNTSPIKLMNGYDSNRHSAGVYVPKADDISGVNYLY